MRFWCYLFFKLNEDIVNKVFLFGRLKSDPRIIHGEKGTIAQLTIVTETTGNDGKTYTDWHRVVGYNSHAEMAEKYLKKGDQVLILGRLNTRNWTEKGETKPRYITEVIIENNTFAGNGTKRGGRHPDDK